MELGYYSEVGIKELAKDEEYTLKRRGNFRSKLIVGSKDALCV
jgi:hypothetical protein